MAKAYMEENKIAFTELDVSADDAAKDDMVKKSGQMAIPVIDIGGKIIIGFDKPAIKKALGI